MAPSNALPWKRGAAPALAALAVFAAALFPLAAHAGTSAEQVVRETTAAVTRAIDENRERLASEPGYIQAIARSLVLPHFDFPTMARLSVTERWQELSAGEQACLARGLGDRLAGRYASILLRYEDQEIRIEPVTAADADGIAGIRQVIDLLHARPVTVEYRLQQEGDDWKVVDLRVDDVSLVLSYREEFRYQIGRLGLGDFLRLFPACVER